MVDLVGVPEPFLVRITCVKVGTAKLVVDDIGPSQAVGQSHELRVRCKQPRLDSIPQAASFCREGDNGANKPNTICTSAWATMTPLSSFRKK